MAKIAHVEGDVVLNIVVSPEGKVTSIKALSGHPILIQAAIDIVQQWEYRRYILDGRARAVTTVVTVKFHMGIAPQHAPDASDIYYNQENKCRGLLNVQAYAEAEAACALLPGLANKLDTPDAKKDQENAYMWAGRAYFKVSKFQDALTAWQHQVVLAKDNHGPDSTELGAAYHNVAHALQATGDLQQASSYYEQALNIFEKAHKDAPDLSLYSEALRSVLRNYALLLRQMG